MAKNKTREHAASVIDFINSVEDKQKREDSFRLLEIMQEVSGYSAKMWGPSIIGFGKYHYKYASGHEGEAAIVGFSPRKAAISLYIFTCNEEDRQLLDTLGKFKMAKACIYIKKLADINIDSLANIIRASIRYIDDKYEIIEN